MSQKTSDVKMLLDVIRRRRNYREFKPDLVSEEDIGMIIEAARHAPSGANTQPWEFIVIRDPERKRRIADIFIETFKKGKKEVDAKFPMKEGIAKPVYRKKFMGAAVLLAICVDTRLKEAYPGYCDRDCILYTSMGAAIEHMQLAAAALGLGMCWGTTNQFSKPLLGELLGVREPLLVTEVFSVGFPVAGLSPVYRRDISSILHFERLDSSKLRTDEEIRNAIATRPTPDFYSGDIARK